MNHTNTSKNATDIFNFCRKIRKFRITNHLRAKAKS